MNKCFLITIFVIIAMVFAACNRTQQQTASEKQTQTYTETKDLFIHTVENPVKIWGWSRDGKVGGSELKDAGNRGGITARAFVFNAVSGTILWEQEIGFYHDEGYSGIPENELTAFFSNFQNVCRQQFGIEIQETRLIVPSESKIRHNGKTYNIAINSIRVEDGIIKIDTPLRINCYGEDIKRYFVTAETDGKKKMILTSEDTFLPALPEFSWYSISPFEERALIIIRWASFSHSYGFEYAGCHLSTGF